MSSWCYMAESSTGDNQIHIRNLLDKPTCETSQQDLTQSADWMDFMDRPNRNSAYDALRCDWILIRQEWEVWGYEYHLERLVRSFQTLVNDKLPTLSSPGIIEQAKNRSRQLFQALLNVVEKTYQSDMARKSPMDMDSVAEDGQIQMIRFTFLWTPMVDSDVPFVRVCGHVYSSGKPISIHQSPASITASLACQLVASPSDASKTHFELDSSTPHRFDQHPGVKQSAWTRKRRPLMKNQQDKYKSSVHISHEKTLIQGNKPIIGEVLMLRESGDTGEALELLEGLSSNVFVVFQDGTVGTARDNAVLPGYVRHLVLQHSSSSRPILLDSSSTKDWREVFITSSSRLILPISEIVVLDQQGQWVEVWSSSPPPPSGVYKWQELRKALLQSHGY